MGSGYIYVLTSLGAVALASFAIYDEERMKASRFALGIILLSALTLPLISAVRGLSELDFSYTEEDSSSSAVEKTVEEAFLLGISRSIEEKFDIKASDISVEAIGFDSEKMSAETLLVTLSGSAAAKDLGRIEDFAEGLGVGKCILEVRFG